MRTTSFLVATFLLTSCGQVRPAMRAYQPVEGERIELRRGGTLGAAITLSVNRQGQGRFEFDDYPQKIVGSFTLKPAEYERLVQLLEPYKMEAVPIQRLPSMAGPWCPNGHRVFDVGFVTIGWVGADYDLRYKADLGCDPEKHAARNKELEDIIGWLSKPLRPKVASRGGSQN